MIEYRGNRNSTTGEYSVSRFSGPPPALGEALAPTPRGLSHSPDGHSWGYNGSGPACLAHSLLFNFISTCIFDGATSLPSPDLVNLYVDTNYQLFKTQIISRLGDNWILTEDDLVNWVVKNRNPKEASV